MIRLIHIFIFAPILVFGQYPPDSEFSFSREYSAPAYTYWHAGSVSTVNSSAILTYLRDNVQVNLNGSSLLLLDSVRSPAGWHFNYQQQYEGISIFGGGVKMNLGNDGAIRSIVDHTVNLPIGVSNLFPPNKLQSIEQREGVVNASTSKIYFQSNGELLPCIRTVVEEVQHVNYEVIYNAAEALYMQDLNRYLGIDSVVSAKVFLPDPLSTAGKVYGGVYGDIGDGDNSALNNERFDVTMIVDFASDSFRLSSLLVEIQDFSGPTTAIAVSGTPGFNFPRSDDRFEDVNCFYHLTAFQKYMQSLGYNLVNYQIGVDAHALGGADNSMFSYPRLYFGDGCVDDAEDADVIIHEYGHAITASAAPNTWVGSERKALDEAAGDYLATSYTRDLNPFNWQLMFGWDGNNVCWPGRTAATSKHYPEDLSGDIHKDGEMWNAALMQIWEVLGRETTDQIYLQSIYSYAQNMSMTDAAFMFLDADSLLNGGANYITCYYWLEKRGFIPPLPFFSGTDGNGDLASCNGVCDATAVVIPISGIAPYTYIWKDSLGNTLPQTNDTLTGLCAANYTVLVTDSAGDTVTVQVAARQPDQISATIKVVDEACSFCDDGEALVQISGGTPPYSYMWNDQSAQTTKHVSGLDSGYYQVSIVDGNGCVYIDSALVGTGTSNILGVAFTNSVELKCNGICDGVIQAGSYGGIPPYTYVWSDGLVQTTSQASDLCSGTFTVTVTDSNGDSIVDSMTLTEALAMTSTTSTIADSGNSEGTATVSVTNGVAPLTYNWSDGQAQTTSTATGLSAGAYTVSWVDSNGCTGNDADTVDLYISVPDLGSLIFAMYPNPTEGILYIKSGMVVGLLDFRIANGLGQIVYAARLPRTGQIDLSGYPRGLYCVQVVYDGIVLRREKLILR